MATTITWDSNDIDPEFTTAHKNRDLEEVTTNRLQKASD